MINTSEKDKSVVIVFNDDNRKYEIEMKKPMNAQSYSSALRLLAGMIDNNTKPPDLIKTAVKNGLISILSVST